MAKSSPDVSVNHPWFLFVYATGRGTAAFDSVPTGCRFQKGDAVYVDAGFKFQGYGADMIRCATIGTPDKDLERYYYAARDTNMAAIPRIGPGMKGKDVYNIWVEEVRMAGFGDSMKVMEDFDWDFLGHAEVLLAAISVPIESHAIPFDSRIHQRSVKSAIRVFKASGIDGLTSRGSVGSVESPLGC